MIANGSMLEAALAYAAQGFRVFPLGERAKEPKIARGAGGRGCYDATTNAATIRARWTLWPYANVGIATGPESDVLLIDEDGPAGRDAIASLEAAHGLLPRTRTHGSGRDEGGLHRLFRWPAGIEHVRGKLRDGVDLKGAGGYLVAPPSVHPSGRAYIVVDEAPLAQLPEPWREIVERPAAPAPSVARPIHSSGEITETSRRAAAYVDRIAGAISGQHGHDHTFNVACHLVRGFGLSVEDAYPILAEWNLRCEPPWNEADLLRKLEEAQGRSTRGFGYLLERERAGARR